MQPAYKAITLMGSTYIFLPEESVAKWFARVPRSHPKKTGLDGGN